MEAYRRSHFPFDYDDLFDIARTADDFDTPNENGVRPLRWCLYSGKIAEVLLKRGAEVNAVDFYGSTAIEYCRPQDINLFVEYGANTDRIELFPSSKKLVTGIRHVRLVVIGCEKIPENVGQMIAEMITS